MPSWAGWLSGPRPAHLLLQCTPLAICTHQKDGIAGSYLSRAHQRWSQVKQKIFRGDSAFLMLCIGKPSLYALGGIRLHFTLQWLIRILSINSCLLSVNRELRFCSNCFNSSTDNGLKVSVSFLEPHTSRKSTVSTCLLLTANINTVHPSSSTTL